MKTEKPFIKKVRVKTTLETYYVCSQESKEIDGIQFLYVIKNIGIRETPKLMRKDSLEYIKWIYIILSSIQVYGLDLFWIHFIGDLNTTQQIQQMHGLTMYLKTVCILVLFGSVSSLMMVGGKQFAHIA